MNENATPIGKPKASPARIAGRTKAAELLREYILGAARRGQSLIKRWAIDLGVSRQYVEQFANPLATKGGMLLGDIEALPAAERAELYRFLAAKADAELQPPPPATDPHRVVVTASVRAGKLAASARDAASEGSRGGRAITADRWEEIGDSCTEGARELDDAARAAYAARDLARRTERKAG